MSGAGSYQVGRVGEAMALEYLRSKGMQLVAQNVRLSGGEIDLVLRDGPAVVFCEVKRRTSGAPEAAYQAVDARKRRRICQAALAYAQHNGLMERPIRFDTVVVLGEGEQTQIRHIPAAFSFEGGYFV